MAKSQERGVLAVANSKTGLVPYQGLVLHRSLVISASEGSLLLVWDLKVGVIWSFCVLSLSV
jgi:hypothetical protein